MGSGKRIDHPWNTIDLGGNFDCRCHAKADANRLPKTFLYRLVAMREGVNLQSVLDFIAWTLRQPKKRFGEVVIMRKPRKRRNKGIR